MAAVTDGHGVPLWVALTAAAAFFAAHHTYLAGVPGLGLVTSLVLLFCIIYDGLAALARRQRRREGLRP